MDNKILCQYGPASDNQPHIVGTVPVSKERVIESLFVTNLVREDLGDTYKGVKYKLHLVKAGENPDTKNCLAYYPEYISGQSVHRYEGIRLRAGDEIVIYCLSGRLSVQAFGEEVPDIDPNTTAQQSIASSLLALKNSQVAWNTATQGCICP